MQENLVFYDGTCGMCHGVVQFLLEHDKKKTFLFAPLQGETAKHVLKDWRSSFPNADTIILVENYPSHKQIFAFGKGGFRICWRLGGFWKIPGLLSFLPGCFYNWGYRWVARHRFQWFDKQACLIPDTRDVKRFLP
ncbi:MAG: DUF393 domain-containing protein [Oligoflexales bacterium]|nr:DUF393 domain-containing protein [Oligoflexales bacterium]